MTRAVVIGPRAMLGRAVLAGLAERGVTTLSAGRSAGDDIRIDLAGEGDAETSGLTADLVLDCAARFDDNSDAGTRANLAVNTAGALAVAALARKVGARAVIHAGTIFANPGSDPGRQGSYGLTKAFGETLLAWRTAGDGIRFASLRFSHFYDTDGLCCRHQPWFGRIIAHAAIGRDIRMPASDGPRNYLHVADAARLMVAAALADLSGIHAAIHPQSLTHQEIAGMAFAAFGRGGQVVPAPDKQPFRSLHYPQVDEAVMALAGGGLMSMGDGIAQIVAAGTSANFGPMDVT